jgi:hypothetical protein
MQFLVSSGELAETLTDALLVGVSSDLSVPDDLRRLYDAR